MLKSLKWFKDIFLIVTKYKKNSIQFFCKMLKKRNRCCVTHFLKSCHSILKSNEPFKCPGTDFGTKSIPWHFNFNLFFLIRILIQTCPVQSHGKKSSLNEDWFKLTLLTFFSQRNKNRILKSNVYYNFFGRKKTHTHSFFNMQWIYLINLKYKIFCNIFYVLRLIKVRRYEEFFF